MSQPHPSASIYVGDLAHDVTEGLLFEIFKRVGTVSSIRVCRDNVTKRSLGYAYVNFVNYDDARRAIDTLNNSAIKGRPCRIMWSIRDPSLRRSGVGNIFIRNLDDSIGPKELYDTFSQFGNIISCKVATYSNGRTKGYGYVHFENQANAEQAIKIVNNRRMGDNIVYVTPFIPRSERQKRIEQTWTNVYVKNLDMSVTEEELRELFSQFGEITSCVLKKKENIEYQFGFLNFKNHVDAVAAVEKMNNAKFKGYQLLCCRAQKKAERQAELRRLYEQRRRERINKYQGLNIYVKNIEDHITEEKLRKEFEPYGKIISLKIMGNDKGGGHKGFGFVCYDTQEEAQRAINEIGKNRILPGCSKPLYVAIHEPREIRQQRFSSRRNQKPQQNVYPPTQGPVFYQPSSVPYSQPQMMRPQNWPVQNLSGMPNFVMQQPQPQGNRGGRGGNRRGGGERNMAEPRQQQQPQTRRFDINELQQFPQSRHKDILGENLYKRIEEREPQLASKITGMIVHSEDFNIESVVELINDDAKLDNIIKEAKVFIEERESHSSVPTEQEGIDGNDS